MELELVTLVIAIINFVLWTFFDYYGFYLITKIKFEIKDLWLVLYFIIGLILSIVNLWFSAINSILQIFIFYWWFKNRNQNQLVLGGILIIEIVDVIEDILINILQIAHSDTLYGMFVSEVTNLALLGIFLFLIYSEKQKLFNLLVSKVDKTFLFLLGYFYLSLEVFSVIVEIQKNRQVILTALFIILVLQSVFIIVAFYFNYSISKRLLDEERQKQLQKHVKDMEDYADYLEVNEDSLRKFKHDVRNLVDSINLNDNTDKQLFTDYVEEYVDANTLIKYKDLNHIKVKQLKNLFLTKIATMINENINYSFECTKVIKNIPKNIEIFDIIRIFGIALDNAIEASKKINNPQINIMLFVNKDNGIEFEVKNMINSRVSVTQVQKKGFTTKTNHSGLGLTNVNEIVSKYPNLSLDLYTEDNNFIFYLVIDEE